MDNETKNVPEIAESDVKIFNTKDARKTFGRISFGLFVVSAVLLLFVFAARAFVPVDILGKPWFAYAFNFVAMYVISFPIGYLLVCSLPKEIPDLDKPNTMTVPMFFRLFASAVCLMYIGNIIGIMVETPFSTVKQFFRDMPKESIADRLGLDCAWLQIIFVAVLAPIIEEIVFRKVIIDRTKRFGYKPAILFSGIVFGLFHGNFGQFFYATLVGFLFGYIYITTGKLINTILMHAAVNVLGGVFPILIFSLMDVEGLERMLLFSESEITLETLETIVQFLGNNIIPILLYVIHAVGFIVLAVFGLIFLIKDRKRYKEGLVKADPPMPKGRAFATMFLNVGFVLFFIVMLYEFYISI